MKNRRKKLDVLREAIDDLEDLDTPHRVEPVLDTIASALKPLCALPAELERMAVPLDQLLAYLARTQSFSREAAKAASRLLEAASVEGYDWERPDGVNESDRDLLFEELNAFYVNVAEEFEDEDEGS